MVAGDNVPTVPGETHNEGFADTWVTLRWQMSYANGPPIEAYELQGRDITRSMRRVEIMLGRRGSASTKVHPWRC